MDLEHAMDGIGDYDMASGSSSGTPWGGVDDKDGMELDMLQPEEELYGTGTEEMDAASASHTTQTSPSIIDSTKTASTSAHQPNGQASVLASAPSHNQQDDSSIAALPAEAHASADDASATAGAKEGGITGSAAEAAVIENETNERIRGAQNVEASAAVLEGVSGHVVPPDAHNATEAAAKEEEDEEDELREEATGPQIVSSFGPRPSAPAENQDFVLFSTAPSPVYYAPSTVTVASDAKGDQTTSTDRSAAGSLVAVQAPQLSVPEHGFREGLDSLCDHLRVKHALGDFLEEGTELIISLPDLQLSVREDDLYAREVTLADLHRIHLGLGHAGSLHLSITEAPRFISRYNALSEQVARLEEEEMQRQERHVVEEAQEELEQDVQHEEQQLEAEEEPDELGEAADGEAQQVAETAHTNAEEFAEQTSELQDEEGSAPQTIEAGDETRLEEGEEFDQTFATADAGEETYGEYAEEEADELDETTAAQHGALHQEDEAGGGESNQHEEYDEEGEEEGGQYEQQDGEGDDTFEAEHKVQGVEDGPQAHADQFEDELLEYEEEPYEPENLLNSEEVKISQFAEHDGADADAKRASIAPLSGKRPLEEQHDMHESVEVSNELKRHKAE
ncbi:Uncharacterised protein family UPF0646 [Ceraceosorus bombacis]|uniref:Uncharacterized protein family UPF0646 n=1 Tax=Ceraceosorus bombacis TaxID=401625 RepID=A0A0P1B748_9BASI|nr:Uncharacterised protein family UPF0646 [Ceraceosorus bombacis]